jgi:hypothetical protein
MSTKRPAKKAAATLGSVAAPATQPAGRRHSRRTVDGALESLDPDDHSLRLAKHKRVAIATLQAAGVVDVRDLLNADPTGAHLRERVLLFLEHEPDSLAGLAARIYELCAWLEVAPQLGYPPKHLMLNAYRLGRLVMLAKVYAPGDELQQAGADARRLYTEADRQAWRDLAEKEFPHHTARNAARLIVQRLALDPKAEETVRKALPKKLG